MPKKSFKQLVSRNVQTQLHKTSRRSPKNNSNYNFKRKIHYTSFYRCTVHFDFYKVHTSTNTLFIKLYKSFKVYMKKTH